MMSRVTFTVVGLSRDLCRPMYHSALNSGNYWHHISFVACLLLLFCHWKYRVDCDTNYLETNVMAIKMSCSIFLHVLSSHFVLFISVIFLWVLPVCCSEYCPNVRAVQISCTICIHLLLSVYSSCQADYHHALHRLFRLLFMAWISPVSRQELLYGFDDVHFTLWVQGIGWTELSFFSCCGCKNWQWRLVKEWKYWATQCYRQISMIIHER